jgi:hypothetical protein
MPLKKTMRPVLILVALASAVALYLLLKRTPNSQETSLPASFTAPTVSKLPLFDHQTKLSPVESTPCDLNKPYGVWATLDSEIYAQIRR